MVCDNPKIPKYLHWGDRQILESSNFKKLEKIYRITKKGNPIEIPEGTITAISCNWSKLIRREHNLIFEESENLGDDYRFCYVWELQKYVRRMDVFNHGDEYSGQQILKCALRHKPIKCNYSHIEILINHLISINGQITYDKCYEHEEWNKCLLKKRKSFKALRKNFRLDMIRLFNKASSQNNYKYYLCHLMEFLTFTNRKSLD